MLIYFINRKSIRQFVEKNTLLIEKFVCSRYLVNSILRNVKIQMIQSLPTPHRDYGLGSRSAVCCTGETGRLLQCFYQFVARELVIFLACIFSELTPD